MKKLCLELTGHSGHFSTILPEAKFDMPFWGENDLPRARNLSVHQVNIGSELGAQSKKSREIYIRHLGEISSMLSDGRLKAPVVEVVGGLSAKTVQKAHGLLESGRVKGKLVMVVE
jgi:NADPH:quinone reductase-like Zn-dependent oxidoreductase